MATRHEERERLQALVAAPGIVVTGAAASWAQAAPERADVLVVSGDDLVASRALDLSDFPPVVVCTDARVAPERLARWGAPSWGVVSRRVTATQLQAAVHAVAEGLRVLPARGASPTTVVDAEDEPAEGVPDEPLTPREREVLQLASDGLSNREIAAALKISEHTVKFHLASLFGKLAVSTRTAALRKGLRRGLITI